MHLNFYILVVLRGAEIIWSLTTLWVLS